MESYHISRHIRFRMLSCLSQVRKLVTQHLAFTLLLLLLLQVLLQIEK